MNRSTGAQDLLTKIADERNVEVLIISEQYRNKTVTGWYSNTSGTSAIWVRGDSRTRIQGSGAGDDFVWVRVDYLTYVSVYLSPNCTAEEFQIKIETLEDALRELPGDLIVAGDLNARAIEWGMTTTNRRGRLLLELAARLNLEVANQGRTFTYRRPGFGYSIPDVTMVTDRILPWIRQWEVIEDLTLSDHQYIVFEVAKNTETPRTRQARLPRWNLKKLDTERFTEMLLDSPAPSDNVHTDLTDEQKTNCIVDETMKLLTRLCDATMPRKKDRPNRQETYWWTDEIGHLRKECIKCRRRMYRARERDNPNAESLAAEYRTARKTLTNEIKNSKKRCWRLLCDEVERDPWGLGYKIATQKLGTSGIPELKDKTTMDTIVDGLFPTHPVAEDTMDYREQTIPDFTAAELLKATAALKPGKAPGPDGIPGEVLRRVASIRPGILLEMYNQCARTGMTSKRWKTARLVLLYKGKGEPEVPSSYRPLSLLDTTGKVYELLLKPRLTDAITAAGGLSENQHGFRKGRSTIGAIREITATVEKTRLTCHGSRPLVLLATLDVKNAFNSARWKDILEALQTFRVPSYLMRIVRDYLRDRRITYETTEGRVTKDITAGVAQGSILGPDFWNVVYDSLLKLEMPHGAFLVAYADDVVVVIVERTPELAQLTLNIVMMRVDRWMKGHGLELALHKTELILLTRRRIDTIIPMTVNTIQMQTRSKVKQLGVTLDVKLTFWPHIKQIAEKAAARVTSLSRLMANTRGPRQGKRRLLMSTTHSILLYGAEIWADALDVKRYRKRLTNVQRQGALRIACAYRTVSAQAVLVIAGVIPIDLLAKERKKIYERRADTSRADAAVKEREETIKIWNERWTNDRTGNWTRRMIVDLRQWTEREYGEVNFYLTQFFSGHGYFRSYLHRRRKVQTPDCTLCGQGLDNAEHTFFKCSRWTVERQELTMTIGSSFTPDTVVATMTQNKDNWERVALFIESTLRAKKDEGCLEN